MFKVGFVVGARGHQHNARRFGGARRQVGQSILQRAKEVGEILNAPLGKHGTHDRPHHRAVFQRIACPGGRLGAITQHPHAPIGATRQISAIDQQLALPRLKDAITRAQKTGVAVNQLQWQQPFADQPARAIEVFHDQIEQLGPLDHPCFDHRPFGFADDERDHVERPRALQSVSRAVDVVGDAIFAHQAADILLQPLHAGPA